MDKDNIYKRKCGFVFHLRKEHKIKKIKLHWGRNNKKSNKRIRGLYQLYATKVCLTMIVQGKNHSFLIIFVTKKSNKSNLPFGIGNNLLMAPAIG